MYEGFYGKYPLKLYIKDAVCDEFYDRLLFKNHFVTDINSPDVDKSVMFSIVKIAENRLFSFQSGDFTTKALPPNFHANIAERSSTAEYPSKRSLTKFR